MPLHWTQNYSPAGSLALSTLLAAIPVCVLLGLLAFGHVKAHIAALAGLAASLAIAIFIYGMPWKLAGMAAVDGAAYGLFPIGWIVLCAIFVYDITVQTGQFEIIRKSVAGLADDRRIQAILIAFSFGAFIEGAAGFGTPVAISAAMLIGLGFRPMQAACLSLIGNTAPVAFGALGTPIIALQKVTGLPLLELSAMVGRQLPFFSLLIPFWIIWAMVGRKKMLEVWPACLSAGLSFAIVQWLLSNFHGPWLVDIGASLASMVSLLILLRFWQPHTVWRFHHEMSDEHSDDSPSPRDEPALSEAASATTPTEPSGTAVINTVAAPTREQIVLAWMPWVVLSLIVFALGTKTIKTFIDSRTAVTFSMPLLDNAVSRAPPVVAKATVEPATFAFNWLSATGTGLLVTAIISGVMLGLSPIRLVRIFCGTLARVRLSLVTIAAMLALGYTTRYGGLDTTLGLAFANTGKLFPFFAPILGWLGVALTGSDTASNAMFGNLQQVTAGRLGISPILATAANSSGGVMGKMIDAQSIVVASVATDQKDAEGPILRYVFFHSIALAALVGLLALGQAYLWPQMIP